MLALVLLSNRPSFCTERTYSSLDDVVQADFGNLASAGDWYINQCSRPSILHTDLRVAQQGQFPPSIPTSPILPSSINYAPSITPNVLDTTAPDAQTVCPGYQALNVEETSSGLTADLSLLGQACNVYGTDVQQLTLEVEYQAQSRLSVKIYPKYVDSSNESYYILAPDLAPTPTIQSGSSMSVSDLVFSWSNSPSFSFKVSRASSGEVLFDTTGSVLVFENQFLELKTKMVENYNIYGLAEGNRGFRLPNNYVQTFWNNYNLTNDQLLDVNTHDTHPVYVETRYANGTSTSHGVFARNAHGQDWVLKPDSITYRTIGGSFDFYFFSGPTAKDVISQYQAGVVKTPYIPAYWHLGFMQCRWGYQNWTNLQDVIDLYAEAGVQLEAIMSDLDYLELNRMFTLSTHYPQGEGQQFLARLHANGQYWLPILNPHVYVPNASESYAPYAAGDSAGAYVQNGDLGNYYGVMWSGFNAIVDFHPRVPQAGQFWSQQISNYHSQIDFDGYWLDVSDPTSFCTGSCGTGVAALENPIHVPFPLPGDSDTMVAVNYMYPPGFEVTNATEAASASAALASQSAAYPIMPSPTPVLPRSTPTPGVRNIQYPPYAIYNHLAGHTLDIQVVSTNATSHSGILQYDYHNLYGYYASNATYNALAALKPGQRPWFASRSTFSGSGNFTGHWGGDTNANWANMYYGISQALQFSISGIPYFGVETCGFNGNSDLELCTRWQQLSAWYGFYRNHNNRNTIAQEVYRWATNIESTKIIMGIRYSLLPYTYTLFWHANQNGSTVLRALAWEFPNDPSLAAVETQFMSGPALLVTPVLQPLVTTVQGVFPGIAEGTKWYDYYTLQPVSAGAGENVTLQAPITHQNIHVRGGYIIPMQKAGNNTKTSRMNAWSLLVALDANGNAAGDLYLDDGISLNPSETKNVDISYSNNILSTTVRGNYEDGIPLANVTIAGYDGQQAAPQNGGWGNWQYPSASTVNITCSLGGSSVDCSGAMVKLNNGTLYITDLEAATSGGAWSGDLKISIS